MNKQREKGATIWHYFGRYAANGFRCVGVKGLRCCSLKPAGPGKKSKVLT